MSPLYMGDRGMGRLGLVNTSSISGMSCRLALVDDEAREYSEKGNDKDYVTIFTDYLISHHPKTEKSCQFL